MMALREHFSRNDRSRHSEWLRQRKWFIKARQDQERKEEIADNDAALSGMLARAYVPMSWKMAGASSNPKMLPMSSTSTARRLEGMRSITAWLTDWSPQKPTNKILIVTRRSKPNTMRRWKNAASCMTPRPRSMPPARNRPTPQPGWTMRAHGLAKAA